MRLLSVGRPTDLVMNQLHDRYAGRIRRFGVVYEATWVRDVRADGKYSDDHVREREAEALLRATATGAVLVALDRSGQVLSSEDLARYLEGWASRLAVFAVGGPLGLHDVVRERAERVWSLSALTFPHELVRVLVAEQIYRALTIRRGLPYHK